MWEEGASEDQKIDDFEVTGKNVGAVHQLYSNINSEVVGNLGDLHGISSEFPNDPCTSDC